MVLINLTLMSRNSCLQKIFEKKFRSAVKGFIYEKLKDSKYELNKNNSNYRGFCFSNLFPIKNKEIKENKVYHINISTNISDLAIKLLEKVNIEDIVNLGEGSFKLIDISIKKENLSNNMILESVSPIIIKSNRKKQDFVNFDIDKDLFIKNLSINLIKKYNFFQNKNIDINYDLFENILIEPLIQKKRLNSHFSILIEDNDEIRKGKPIYIYGNRLKFKIIDINDLQKEILQIGLETGFGSMNSYGLGFMRIIK